MCREDGCAIPYGLCQCGCGRETKAAPYTSRSHGYVRGEPTRFCRGHRIARPSQDALTPPNPSGLCQCGCGQVTPVATTTARKYGWVQGEHLRYLKGHRALALRRGVEPPNPSGLCQCGCGQPTPIAQETSSRKGWLKGHPMRYLPMHHKGVGLSPAERIARRVRREDTPEGCWEWVGKIHPSGYPRTGIGGRARPASHIAWEVASGEPMPEGAQILHTCDNPRCVRNDDPGTYEVGGKVLRRFGHLVLGNAQENAADKVAKGRQHRGRKRHPGTFTDDEVQTIRYAYQHRDVTKVTIEVLAERYGRSELTIINVLHRRRYADVPDADTPPRDLARAIGVPVEKARGGRRKKAAPADAGQLTLGF